MPRILIVEDEPTVRNLLQEIIGHAYECRAVKSAEEGLTILRSEIFDVAITDVKLPGMGGEEFLKELNYAPPATCKRPRLSSQKGRA